MPFKIDGTDVNPGIVNKIWIGNEWDLIIICKFVDSV